MNYRRLRYFAIGAMALATTLGFKAFAANDDPALASPPSTKAAQMGDMPYDLHFIDMMIMHYQDGIELSQLAQTKAQNPRVKTVAQKTEAAETNELKELRTRRDSWFAGKPIMDMSAMMQMMHPGMMSMDETRRKLRAIEGTAFDGALLDAMIQVHQMAIDMSKDATTTAEHPELRELARNAVLERQREVAEMKTLRGGTAPKPTRGKPKAKAMPHMTHMR